MKTTALLLMMAMGLTACGTMAQSRNDTAGKRKDAPATPPSTETKPDSDKPAPKPEGGRARNDHGPRPGPQDQHPHFGSPRADGPQGHFEPRGMMNRAPRPGFGSGGRGDGFGQRPQRGFGGPGGQFEVCPHCHRPMPPMGMNGAPGMQRGPGRGPGGFGMSQQGGFGQQPPWMNRQQIGIFREQQRGNFGPPAWGQAGPPWLRHNSGSEPGFQAPGPNGPRDPQAFRRPGGSGGPGGPDGLRKSDHSGRGPANHRPEAQPSDDRGPRPPGN